MFDEHIWTKFKYWKKDSCQIFHRVSVPYHQHRLITEDTMTFLEWRKFNFFDLHKNVDGGKLAEALQDTTIEVYSSGYSQLVIGDAKGWVHIFSRSWKVTSFKAYDHSISQIVQLRHDPCIVTIGEDEAGVTSVIKVWDGSRQDGQGRPICLRVTKLSRMKQTPTCLTIHDNKNLMAVGFDDGSIVLFKGDITRQRSSKEIDLRSKPSDSTPITGLAFKGTTHLFVASRSSVMVYTIGSGGKERGIIMDEGANGCRPNCAVLIQDQQFVVAKFDAIFCYTTDGKGPCYAIKGTKKRVDWFRSYLVIISKQDNEEKSSPNEESPPGDLITILDIQNKFIVFSMVLDEVKAVITEWGAFYILTEDKQVHHLDEKDLQTKLSLLFKKNLYDVAIRIASSQKYDSERLIDIYTQYGDHLFKKGEPKGAVEQYIKTIGKLESSYVIRKYLESRHLEPLTYYLQELHKMGLATEDHTTLLLTCFIKLDQHDHQGKLKEFINAKDRVFDFDVEIAIKICRQVSSEDALNLAERYKQHDWYLTIITEDVKDFRAALDYISDLEFDDADTLMKKYGNILMQNIPAETTQFLKELCIDYKPKNKPLVDDAMMAGVVLRNKADRARPEEYIHLFLNNSERLVEFLEHLVKAENNWPTVIYNILIEHHLHVWSTLKDKPDLRETYEEKVLKLLQNPEANYDKDQTLIVCLMLNFKPGILFLYEENKLYQQILRYHISQKDVDSAINFCRKFGAQEPHLWVEMLWSLPSSEHLPEVLNVIANQRLLSPLLVIDHLTNSPIFTLGDVRKYLVNVLTDEADISNREALQGDRLRGEAISGRNELKEAMSKPMVCQASRCAACSQPLELPARHFLCSHSYHQHCFQSFSENEDECPACVPNNKKLLEVLRNQGTSAQTTEAFHAQLEKAHDGFSVVAEYFGRGIFNKLTIITGDDMPVENKQVSKVEPLNLDNSVSMNKTIMPKKPDSLNYGPGAEARLRLEEGMSTKQVSLESQRPTGPKSSILIPTAEARIRLIEQQRQDLQYSSSLEANINRFPQIESTSKQFSDRENDRESSKNTTPAKNSPVSLKSKKIDKISSNIDNISIGSTSSTRNDKPQTSKAVLNPFDDDAKNPFDDDEDVNGESKNPFEDDDSDKDKSKNPFA